MRRVHSSPERPLLFHFARSAVPAAFRPEYGRGTDWIDEITRTAIYQNYNLRQCRGREVELLRGSGAATTPGYRRTQRILTTARQILKMIASKRLTVGFKGSYTFPRHESPTGDHRRCEHLGRRCEFRPRRSNDWLHQPPLRERCGASTRRAPRSTATRRE